MDSTSRQLLKHEMPERAKVKPYVVQLLNMKANSVAGRLALIVEAYQRVEQLCESIRLSPASETTAQRAERAKARRELNARLSGYKWHPTVAPSMERPSYLEVSYGFDAANHQEATENRAVVYLMRNTAKIHRIRRCHRLQCRMWFFAVTEHQKYCSENCRKRDAQQGPEFKRKRAAYMREVYRAKIEPEREEQSRRQAARVLSEKSKKGGK